MEKEIILNFLSSLEKNGSLKKDVTKVFKLKAQKDTVEAILWGVALWYNKPTMLENYLNRIKG